MNRMYLTAILFSLLFLASCTKEYLTEDSKWGNNTFSCKINGKVYVAKDDLFAQGIVTNTFYGTIPGTYSFRVKVNLYNGNNNFGIMILILNNVINAGEHAISPGIANAEVYIGNVGEANNAQQGKITISRMDRSAKILSGSFEFVAVRDSEPNVNKLTVTKGRFDVKL